MAGRSGICSKTCVNKFVQQYIACPCQCMWACYSHDRARCFNSRGLHVLIRHFVQVTGVFCQSAIESAQSDHASNSEFPFQVSWPYSGCKCTSDLSFCHWRRRWSCRTSFTTRRHLGRRAFILMCQLNGINRDANFSSYIYMKMSHSNTSYFVWVPDITFMQKADVSADKMHSLNG